MKRISLNRGRIIIGGLILLVIASIPFFLGGNTRETGTDDVKYKDVAVERGAFQILVNANGIVQPIDRIQIKSKASGEVVELPIEQGDEVRKGDLIARLDQKDERAAYSQAEADLDIAKAELNQAQRTYDRRLQLFENQLISQEELDQIELSLAVARGKLVQATTTLERAKERLAEAVVRAPIDGVILQKYVEEGQIIASGVTNVSGGTPIVDLADMRSVYIQAGIDEIDIGKVKVGQEVSVVADAYPTAHFTGVTVRIAPEAKIEQNVTLFDVVVKVENTNGRLKSGMNTSIEITIDRRENVLLIPAIALQQNQPEERKGGKRGAATVLLKEDGSYAPRTIGIGPSNFTQVIVTSGLEEGDVLGVPMISRLKEENEQLENRIRSSRSFGTSNRSQSR